MIQQHLARELLSPDNVSAGVEYQFPGTLRLPASQLQQFLPVAGPPDTCTWQPGLAAQGQGRGACTAWATSQPGKLSAGYLAS